MTSLQPKPKQTVLCQVCELDWDKHIKESQSRYRRDWYAQFDDDDFQPPVNVVFATVELIDCISLLKRVNEGPIGYTGPTGATGRCSCTDLLAGPGHTV